jgi:DNA-binding transcriptional LysR family regulator
MELRHLRYFIAVAEELHFARAAERLQMAQQPLSAQIRQLEEELDVVLFERTTRRVSLTDAGRVFLEKAYETIHAFDQAMLAAQEAKRGERGEIRIGYASTTLYNIMPPLMRAFRERFPQIRVILHELTCISELDEKVIQGDLDVSLTGDPAYFCPAPLEHIVLCREPVVVVLPETHRLATWKDIPLQELDNEPFIQYDRHEKTHIHQLIASNFRERGITLNNVQEATTEQAMIGLAAAGIGVSLVCASLSGLRQTEVVYRRLIEPSLDVEFIMTWRRDRISPVIQSFLQVAQELAVGSFVPAYS